MSTVRRPSWNENRIAIHIAWWREHPEAVQGLKKPRDRVFAELIAGLNFQPKHSCAQVARLHDISPERVREVFLQLAGRSSWRCSQEEQGFQERLARGHSQAGELGEVVAELNISPRAYNSLMRAGLRAITDLTSRTKTELENVEGLGQKSRAEVIAALAEKGLTLRKEQKHG